jgi:hypothetical protein
LAISDGLGLEFGAVAGSEFAPYLIDINIENIFTFSKGQQKGQQFFSLVEG